MTLVYTHLFFSLTTFLLGLFVFISKQSFSFKNPIVMGYIHIHLLTAITGLFLGDKDIARFSPFQWLSVITIGSYVLCVNRIVKKQYLKAAYPMLGAYLGLCIAFAGALHPERLTGYRLWTKTLNLTTVQANNSWTTLMIVVTIPCLICMIYFNVIEFKNRKNKFN